MGKHDGMIPPARSETSTKLYPGRELTRYLDGLSADPSLDAIVAQQERSSAEDLGLTARSGRAGSWGERAAFASFLQQLYHSAANSSNARVAVACTVSVDADAVRSVARGPFLAAPPCRPDKPQPCLPRSGATSSLGCNITSPWGSPDSTSCSTARTPRPFGCCACCPCLG